MSELIHRAIHKADGTLVEFGDRELAAGEVATSVATQHIPAELHDGIHSNFMVSSSGRISAKAYVDAGDASSFLAIQAETERRHALSGRSVCSQIEALLLTARVVIASNQERDPKQHLLDETYAAAARLQHRGLRFYAHLNYVMHAGGTGNHDHDAPIHERGHEVAAVVARCYFISSAGLNIFSVYQPDIEFRTELLIPNPQTRQDNLELAVRTVAANAPAWATIDDDALKQVIEATLRAADSGLPNHTNPE